MAWQLMHASPGCIETDPWFARVQVVELVHLSGVSYGFVATTPASTGVVHASFGIPAVTQAANAACSIALGATSGFGGITPVCMSFTEYAPTFWDGSSVAVATRLS